jgi:transposase
MSFMIGQDRNQVSFYSLEDSISPDNPVRVLDAFVDKLELEKLDFINTTAKSEGRPLFHPALFLRLYLYGYLNRIRSSRKLQTECERNIEVRWLLKGLAPNYHSIADFRKIHSKPLKSVFKAFGHFLKDQALIEGTLVAIDGTKIRAQNSKKNNYNQKKIDHHLQYIENKTIEYLKELDGCDQAENQSGEIVIKKEQVKEHLKNLQERKIKYETQQQQLFSSANGQISTTDPDSRLLNTHHGIVEVSYNIQTAVDAAHNLIADFEATNTSDINALHDTACEVKSTLEVADLSVLTDKGYHNGAELQKCAASQIITYVAYSKDATKDHFTYNKETDTYSCSQGQILTTNGTWYTSKKDNRIVRFKQYRTPGCKDCPLKSTCTTRVDGRRIERNQYQDWVDLNNKRVDENKALYKRRQAIVEHPFGTIKRSWGYTYTLLKGITKVNAEMALIYLAYNIRRSMTILGVEELIKRIKEWKGPKYPSLHLFSVHFRAYAEGLRKILYTVRKSNAYLIAT